jgi:predicted amidohydrolase
MLDIIDLFTETYDSLFRGLGRSRVANLLFHSKDPTVRTTAAVLLDNERQSIPNATDVERMGVLQLIDERCGFINPWFSGGVRTAPTTEMRAVRDRYDQTGNFSGGRRGLVLPRPYRRAEPTCEASDAFKYLLRVPRRYDSRIKITRRSDLPSLPRSMTVGTICFLASGEVALERRDDVGQTWYLTLPQVRDIRARVHSALVALDRSGVDLALVPECSIDKESLRVWQKELSSHHRPTFGRLRLLLVGSGNVRNRPKSGHDVNKAVLLNRDGGDVVMTQDKRASYAMTYSDLAGWGFSREFSNLPRSPAAQEWMTEGRILQVLENPPTRLAILICEDLARIDRHLDAAIALGITHVLVPVLSPPLRVGAGSGYGWEANSGREYARRAGCHVIVANSLAHPSHRGRRHNVSLAYSPGLWRPDSYQRPARVAVRRASSPVSVGRFECI